MADNTDRNIFRLVHFSNVGEILRNGMYSKSGHVTPDYVNIGDTVLIRQRETFKVRIDPPGGNLGDYIPFYFAGHSPMLLNIKTGYRGITQLPQSDLVYFVCKISGIVNECPEWCFTDGHAKNSITKFFNRAADLDKLDWTMIHEQYWQATEDDMDRTRRKQAEFLVKNHVPVSCVCGIIVLNDESKDRIEELESNVGIRRIPIYVDKERKYFYP